MKSATKSLKRRVFKNKLPLFAAILITIVVGTVGLTMSRATSQAGPPNVVYVMIDDARPDEMQQVADLKPGGGFDWIRDNGTVFDKLYSGNNACCPGRTIGMTGQTSYNNGVLTNVTWKDLSNALPAWLQQAGYCTGFAGKWLNPYNGTQPTPGGWTYWEAITAGLSDPNDPEDDSYTIMKRDGTTWQPGVYMTDHLADLSDFIIMGTFIFGMASLFVLAARRVSKKNRLVVAVVFALAFLYIWAELAVGVFTDIGS